MASKYPAFGKQDSSIPTRHKTIQDHTESKASFN